MLASLAVGTGRWRVENPKADGVHELNVQIRASLKVDPKYDGEHNAITIIERVRVMTPDAQKRGGARKQDHSFNAKV